MGSNRSPASLRSRSESAASNRSDQSNRSLGSNRSRSISRSRSRSPSQSGSCSRSVSLESRKSNRSRSRSVQSNRSVHSNGSKTPSQRSRSRSHSSRSRSRSVGSNKSGHSNVSRSNRSRSRSRSRSGSRVSNRSRSPSVGSRKSNGSRSKSVQSFRSAQSFRSDSKTPSQRSLSRSRSGSHSPNLDNGNVGNINELQTKGLGSQNEDTGTDAADLFGDADDISSDEEKAKEAATGKEGRSDIEEQLQPIDQDEDRARLSGDEREYLEEEKEAEPEPIPETRIDVKIPKISCDLGKEIHFVKLPNFLSVETRPFDPETYEDEIDEEETLDEEGRARLKLKVENTIRWKDEINKDGDFEKHSNARLVRWSDGSLSLHLGSEIFDVYKQPLQGDHNHLFIRQGTGLQGQAVFRTKLSFRPHSTESFTHRKMTLSLADRSQKTTGIKILSQVGVDPDQDRKTLLKKEEEKLRQTFRMSKPRKRGEGSRLHVGQVYREEDGSEDEGAISLNAIKNKYKSGANLQSKGGAIYSSDEEGSDFEARRMKKLDKPKALKDSESSEESD